MSEGEYGHVIKYFRRINDIEEYVYYDMHTENTRAHAMKLTRKILNVKPYLKTNFEHIEAKVLATIEQIRNYVLLKIRNLLYWTRFLQFF